MLQRSRLCFCSLHFQFKFNEQTEILKETSVSLTGTIVDWNNHREVAEEMEDICVRSHRLPLHANTNTCSSLMQRCFPAWKRQYGAKPTREDVCEMHAQTLHTMQASGVMATGENGGRHDERVGPTMGKYRR